jgi:hypothetical protein
MKSIVLSLIVSIASVGAAKAQQCLGCTCTGGPAVHPVRSQGQCLAGCAIFEIVCGSDNIVCHRRDQPFTPFSTIQGPVPEDCGIRVVYNGGTITGPATGCDAAPPGKGVPPFRDPCHPMGLRGPNAC